MFSSVKSVFLSLAESIGEKWAFSTVRQELAMCPRNRVVLDPHLERRHLKPNVTLALSRRAGQGFWPKKVQFCPKKSVKHVF